MRVLDSLVVAWIKPLWWLFCGLMWLSDKLFKRRYDRNLRELSLIDLVNTRRNQDYLSLELSLFVVAAVLYVMAVPVLAYRLLNATPAYAVSVTWVLLFIVANVYGIRRRSVIEPHFRPKQR